MSEAKTAKFHRKTIILENGDLKFSAYHYNSENKNAPLVFCLHGFPDNWNTFKYQIDDLIEAGYQIIIPQMRGYQPSSIPENLDFKIDAIVSDVVSWIDQLGATNVHIVGHDWGCIITYVVADAIPEKINSITTIAVPHTGRFLTKGLIKVPIQILKSWYILMNLIPGLSEYLFKRNDWALLKNLWKLWSPGFTPSDEEWNDLKSTFDQPGVFNAILQYYRQNTAIVDILGIRKSKYRLLKEVNVPNLAITGENDGCIDSRTFDYCILEEDYPKGYKLARIKNAGHFTHLEAPEEVNKLIVDWLKSNDS